MAEGPRGGWAPGVGLPAFAASAAFGIHVVLPFIPWLTASILLGVMVSCVVPARPALGGVLKPGLTQTSRRVLRIGIVLLGLQLSLFDIAKLGWLAILAIIALVGASFVT